jgi:sulfate/thiosulfate transport system permease protein
MPARDTNVGAVGDSRVARWSLRTIALAYLVVVLLAPLVFILYRTFEHGFDTFWTAVTSEQALHALWLTVLITAITVPLNAIFGVAAALILVRRRVPGRTLISALIDLPLALSPVVVGLCVVIVWGQNGWLGGYAEDAGVQVLFAVPGMVLATIFVCIPFVVREVVPVLREVGTDQEEAAATLGASGMQTFWKITLPAIRWGVIYGVILTTARALGEYGAVAVVSGQISGNTETMTLFVKQQYDQLGTDARVGAYGASVVLILLAIIVVVLMNLLNRKGGGRGYHGV